MQSLRAGGLTAKIRDPFESGTVQSEVPRSLHKQSPLHRSGFPGGTFKYSTHAHIHSSEMPSSSSASVFTSRSSRSSSTSAGINRKLQRSDSRRRPAVASPGVRDGPPVTGTSHRKNKQTNKQTKEEVKARDGKRSAMYVQVKLLSQDRNNGWIMAQVLVFFATSKCSPRVVKWVEQTSRSCRCAVCARQLALKRVKKNKLNCDSS